MELTSIKVIRDLFERHGFAFSKSLGQNFLINSGICPKLAEQGGARKGVSALEIGTGIGVLTKELASLCDKVLAIEIDRGLAPILEETLSEFDNVEVVYGDVLSLDLLSLIKEKLGETEIICCANLPYYITSPVIMKLLEDELPLKSITVMVQKEAGDRITALPGTRECGSISAAIRYYAEPRKLFSVSRGSFMPAPNVDSVVIGLNVYERCPYNVTDKELFFKIIHTAFSQRRKQIVNLLTSVANTDKDSMRELLAGAGINPLARAEELTMKDFETIYLRIKTLL